MRIVDKLRCSKFGRRNVDDNDKLCLWTWRSFLLLNPCAGHVRDESDDTFGSIRDKKKLSLHECKSRSWVTIIDVDPHQRQAKAAKCSTRSLARPSTRRKNLLHIKALRVGRVRRTTKVNIAQGNHYLRDIFKNYILGSCRWYISRRRSHATFSLNYLWRRRTGRTDTAEFRA